MVMVPAVSRQPGGTSQRDLPTWVQPLMDWQGMDPFQYVTFPTLPAWSLCKVMVLVAGGARLG